MNTLKMRMSLAVAFAFGAGTVLAQAAEALSATVNDGGVEAVREAVAAAPAEPPTKIANAEDDVKAWLKGKKWKPGWDSRKKRFIQISTGQFDCDDPAKAQDVVVRRDMAVKRAVLSAKMDIIEAVKTEVDAEDIVEMMGATAPGTPVNEANALKNRVQKLKQSSSAEFRAEMPLFGATCVRQSESWNRGKYQVAVALVWSPALERSARAVITGEKVVCKPKENGKSIEEWLDAVNPAFMSGPLQVVDADGTRWFLGISAGAANEGLDSLTLKTNRRLADLSAKQMLAFSIWGDVKANETLKQELTSMTVKGKSTTEVAQWLESKVSQSIKGLPIRGMSRLLGEEVEHPVTGGRIYVSIYGINQNAAEDMLKVEAVNYATRTELERTKAAKRGAVRKDSVARKGPLVDQRRETSEKRDKKARSGVFNGGAVVDDDDL